MKDEIEKSEFEKALNKEHLLSFEIEERISLLDEKREREMISRMIAFQEA